MRPGNGYRSGKYRVAEVPLLSKNRSAEIDIGREDETPAREGIKTVIHNSCLREIFFPFCGEMGSFPIQERRMKNAEWLLFR
jgi:hypothetical protein